MIHISVLVMIGFIYFSLQPNELVPNMKAISEKKDFTTSAEEDIEMEISDDMLNFFTQSMKHKIERSEKNMCKTHFIFCNININFSPLIVAEEINGKNSDQIHYVNIDELPVETRPGDDAYNTKTVDFNEDKHLHSDLYGSNAARIHAMETAIQLNFNRNCDRKQPKLWPNMPLNM